MNDGNTKTKVLVIGAAGHFGAAITRALVEAGHEVKALRRASGRPIEMEGVEVVHGDALRLEDVRRAADGAEVIVHAFNVPYPEWDPTLFEAATVVSRVAAERGALIVLPGNVYGLDPSDGTRLREDAPKKAMSAKSAMRNRLEDQLTEATQHGARLLIVRAGDYIGPGNTGTWFHEMTKKVSTGGALTDPGNANVVHEWAYLPDLAEATVRLIDRRAELAAVETFHFTSFQLTSRALLEAVNEALPAPRAIRAMPWWLLKPVALFVPMLRELFDVKYLWERQLLLDDGKLTRFLGDVQRTPLQQALQTTLGVPSGAEVKRAA